ncbi:MAG: dihydrolipoamide acetyltransferase family protein [Pseudomonadota bacterium]
MADALYPVTVPKWGIEMQEGTITGWQVSAGSALKKGDELIDIETDKIVNTMEAPVDGVLCRQLAQEGDTLKVGELLGVIATADAQEADIDAFVEAFQPADASFGIDDAIDAQPDAPDAPVVAAEAASAVRVSPVAKRLAKKLGLDLATVQGTGRNGRISKEDVEAAAANAANAGGAAAGNPEPFSSRRQAIARKLVAAKAEIPHYYLTRTIGADNLLSLKSSEVSLNAAMLKAAALALTEHPRVNCHVLDGALDARSSVDINMAIDTDQGLTAPLLRNVDRLSLVDLSRAAAELAGRARANQLNTSDLELGGFTVSNLGGLGIESFTAIINPPQAAILAVGAIVDGRFKVTLSADHRVIDGADGARFLQTLAARMEDIRE